MKFQKKKFCSKRFKMLQKLIWQCQKRKWKRRTSKFAAYVMIINMNTWPMYATAGENPCKKGPKLTLKMGRRSKAALAKLNNILSAGNKHRATVEDIQLCPGARWFKGMEIIIWERGLWPQNGLNAQCEGFKCEMGKTDCCCRRLLFSQSDFVNQN